MNPIPCKEMTIGAIPTGERITNQLKIIVMGKIEKENLLKRLADKYKSQLPIRVYNALYNYQVEITD